MNILIEKSDNEFVEEYRVVGQDSCFPVPLYYGIYEECCNWLKEKLTNE